VVLSTRTEAATTTTTSKKMKRQQVNEKRRSNEIENAPKLCRALLVVCMSGSSSLSLS